jgi:hypothetical protein
MKISVASRFLSWFVIILLLCARQPAASAAPVPVRYINGTIHGFLELRSQDGEVIASGDMAQVAHGSKVTTRLIFTFKDGSIDDETTVFTQHRNFQLVSDHHIQKGPFFPHPMDVMIDARSGQVTVRSTGKDGKEEVKTDHVQLPSDLANGMVSTLIQNISPDSSETRVSILVATPKLRIVTLSISPHGEENFSLAGESRKATHYEIRIDLGGVSGIVAPLIGKQPPNIHLWIMGGPAPTFLKEDGPIYPEGPSLTIQLASPTWPQSKQSGN